MNYCQFMGYLRKVPLFGIYRKKSLFQTTEIQYWGDVLLQRAFISFSCCALISISYKNSSFKPIIQLLAQLLKRHNLY